jgi:chromosome segregation ATPase
LLRSRRDSLTRTEYELETIDEQSAIIKEKAEVVQSTSQRLRNDLKDTHTQTQQTRDETDRKKRDHEVLKEKLHKVTTLKQQHHLLNESVREAQDELVIAKRTLVTDSQTLECAVELHREAIWLIEEISERENATEALEVEYQMIVSKSIPEIASEPEVVPAKQDSSDQLLAASQEVKQASEEVVAVSALLAEANGQLQELRQNVQSITKQIGDVMRETNKFWVIERDPKLADLTEMMDKKKDREDRRRIAGEQIEKREGRIQEARHRTQLRRKRIEEQKLRLIRMSVISSIGLLQTHMNEHLGFWREEGQNSLETLKRWDDFVGRSLSLLEARIAP